MPPPASPRPATPRFDTVDALRGIAIVLVILLHGRIRMFFAGASLKGTMPQSLLHLLFSNGNQGVTVFFAISGFLITLTSIRRFGGLAGMRTGTFYRIRFARIAPPLLLLLAVLSLFHLAGWGPFVITAKHGGLPRALLSALTFTLNWWEGVKGYLPASWDVLWSLSVEEAFYVAFPLVCLLLLRQRRFPRLGLVSFVALLLAFVTVGHLSRSVWTEGRDIWQEKSYLGGMDSIALGCLTAMVTDWLQRRGRSCSQVLLLGTQSVGAALMLLVAFYPRTAWMQWLGRHALDDNVLALGTCMVILPSVLRNRPGRAWGAPLRWFGRLSYEVYLTHEFAVILLTLLYEHRKATGQLTGSPVLWILAMLVASAPLGYAMARYWSEPMNRRLRSHKPVATA